MPTDEKSRARAGAGRLNRMELWSNDDLLLTSQARASLELDYPGALRVFDWKGLRELFHSFDATASESRKRRQRLALIAISVAGIGAILSGTLPVIELLGADIVRWWFGISALLSAVGLIWTALLILMPGSKAQWLEHRLRTERLRQFYFQFMISDPGMAVLARNDDAALKAWIATRDEALQALKAWLQRPMQSELTAVIEDVNHKLVWQRAQWRSPPVVPAAGAGLAEYFEILRRQRLAIQLAYVSEKLAVGFGSPETRLAVLRAAARIGAAGAVLSALAAAALLFAGQPPGAFAFRLLTSLTGLFGVITIFVKVLEDGLGLRSDIERYRWYRDAVADLNGRFNDPDPGSRVAVLRELELISYREMREFLRSHHNARFSLA
jgi:hypothetical protein